MRERDTSNVCQLTHLSALILMKSAQLPPRLASCTHAQPARRLTFQLIIYNLFVHSREIFPVYA